MPGPVGLPVIDTMMGFPHEGSAQYDFIRKQTKDRESKEDFEFPVEYMFKDVPKGLSTDDPVSLVLQQMDRFGYQKAMIGVGEDLRAGPQDVPGPFRAVWLARMEPNNVMGSVNAIRRDYEQFGIRATSVFPAGTFPQVAHRRPEDVSHLCHLRRPSAFRSSSCAWSSRPAGSFCTARSLTYRRRDV